LGRRVGLLAFLIPVAGATAIWTAQILRQVFWPGADGSHPACRGGIVALDQAVRRARLAAAADTGGERSALDLFRRSLFPEWQSRVALDESCKADPSALQALADLDALRYAEEHAVRYEASALAKQRRRSDAIRREFAGHTGF
jgi:hypothetical protein